MALMLVDLPPTAGVNYIPLLKNHDRVFVGFPHNEAMVEMGGGQYHLPVDAIIYYQRRDYVNISRCEDVVMRVPRWETRDWKCGDMIHYIEETENVQSIVEGRIHITVGDFTWHALWTPRPMLSNRTVVVERMMTACRDVHQLGDRRVMECALAAVQEFIASGASL